MADDLGNEWWEEPAGDASNSEPAEEVKESEESKGNKKKKIPSGKTQVKRKKEVKVSQEAEKEDSAPKKKRRKKKTISDVLAQHAPTAGTPEDMQKLVLEHFENKRSVIELEELQIPDTCFVKENDLTHTLSSYLKEICPKWSKLSKNHKEKKSVLLLVVCSSAHRTLELIKLINAFKADTKVMKLFAKHIKIKDQINLLEKNVTHIGIGTPGRIKALIDQDGLSLESMKYLVFDWNWRDQKLRRMMDIPEVKKETLELLDSGLIRASRAGTLKIGLF
ncbi:protein CMSS1 [Xenopus laevis]|uniref:Protein CMSS1 n=1 Tax=Xenopus laevis TaxID=8355 RepID=CMS1_XENLA|nr:protein CMSS1 [Xenopus laevis]Q68EV5.1 RecName: Full=Protein CMSS1; AltName: Full=Cms1 ribosomal small subunit homolog [Xenopus laevis]AAH80095.1 MGC84286 protein [Xenopus laevis]